MTGIKEMIQEFSEKNEKFEANIKVNAQGDVVSNLNGNLLVGLFFIITSAMKRGISVNVLIHLILNAEHFIEHEKRFETENKGEEHENIG